MEIYIVKSGDTINRIAQAYGINMEVLIQANGLPNPEKLLVGQAIVIPDDNDEVWGQLSVNGYAYTYINKEILRESLPYLTFVSPFTYGFNLDGTLVDLQDEGIRSELTGTGTDSIMHLTTLTPEGKFSNELAKSFLSNESIWQVLAGNIINTIEEKGYSGLDIDFEYVPSEVAEAYVAWLAYIGGILRENGYFLMTALAPKVAANQRGLLYEGHDYYGIGRVSDYVLLMTYEWGYTYGPPMAVAPIPQVRRVLDYAVTEIPADKIYMGIPNYGYDWTLPFVRGTSKARSIGNVEAIEIASKYNAEILFDEAAMSPYFYYTDEEGRAHAVWFEDARSIDAKMSLIREYNFYGAGVWNVMRTFPQGWLVMSERYSIKKNG